MHASQDSSHRLKAPRQQIHAELLQLGSAAGVTVVLDCGGADADVDPELLKHLTIISPNESELANLTGSNNWKICGQLMSAAFVAGGSVYRQAQAVFLAACFAQLQSVLCSI